MDIQKLNGVVLVMFPLQGHITPLLQLGSLLHSKGFHVTVLHPDYNAPNSANHPEFTFLSLPDGLSGKEASYPDPFLFMAAMNDNCKSYIQQNLERLQGNVSCVVFDALMGVAESVAVQVGIPSIVVRTVPAASLLTYPIILQLHDQNLIPLPESQHEDPVPSLEFLRFKDLSFFALEMTKPLLQSVRSLSSIKSSKAVILNTVECLEELAVPRLQQWYQLPLFTVGPIHKVAPHHNQTSLIKQDDSCIQWLDKQAPCSVIYVSLGSLATVDKEELIETAWGLVESEQPFLWVIRSNLINGSPCNECLPNELAGMIEERGLVVQWAPQTQILAHSAIGAFLSHCGWNSTLEGISEGVPILCRPSFADQLVNARYVSQVWRVGFELENAKDRTVVRNAIRRLLVDEEGKEIREKSHDLKQTLEVHVLQGGSSYNAIENLIQFILSL